MRGRLRAERVSRVLSQCLPVWASVSRRHVTTVTQRHALFSLCKHLTPGHIVTPSKSLILLASLGFCLPMRKVWEDEEPGHVPDIIRPDTEWRGLESHWDDNVDTISQHSRDRAKIQTISGTAWYIPSGARNPSLCVVTWCHCVMISWMCSKHSQIPGAQNLKAENRENKPCVRFKRVPRAPSQSQQTHPG